VISLPHIAAIIPAAGLSSRFDSTNKLVQRLGGRTVIERVVSMAVKSGCRSAVVVTGHENERIRFVLKELEVSIVFNEAFQTGMGSSIAAGVASQPDVDGYLIWPADMPLVKLETIRSIIDAHQPSRIVTPVYKQRPGHPVLFSSVFRDELLRIDPSGGARPVLEENTKAVYRIETTDPGIFKDIDTIDDLEEAHLHVDTHL